MNTTKRPILTYLVFLAIYLTACASGPQIGTGDVINLYHTTAEWIVDGCMSGECASHIYVKDQLIVYARPLVDNVAFVVTSKGIPVDKLTGLSGNLVNCETWQDFQAWMLSNGFTVASVTAPVYRTVMSVAGAMANMELIPIFALVLTPETPLPEWITGSVTSE
jgi:hypothetical protein